MANPGYLFSVGKFECRVISDGTIVIPDTINNRPFDPRDPGSGIVTEVMSLYVNTGKNRVLIDTGCGNGTETSSYGKLLQNLAAAGIKAQDIDTVVLSHAHSDHAGGNVCQNGKPVFSGARYVIHRREWEHWTERLKSGTGDMLGMFSVTRKKLLPVQDRIEMVEAADEMPSGAQIVPAGEIVPGIEFIPVPGHTPGHMMLKISSGKSTLIFLADIMHHTLELTRPELFTIFDVEPREAVRIRSGVVAELAASGDLVFACHLAYPGLGHFTHKDGVYSWQPLSTCRL
ncbi:MAG: MBL fold metallo-hydrolase [Dehalococcoidales bacterium]|nr:MBL fold metallo-hydrolase [Dehalococcoidales bacterium]